MAAREKVSRYNLVTGEDTYASQTSQNPATSRRVQSWVPMDDGALWRENAQPLFLSTLLSGPVLSLYEFDMNDVNGNVVRFYFAAAATNFTAGTRTCNLYVKNGAAWSQVTAVGTLQNPPMFRRDTNNLLHMVDGAVNWIFDGSNWELEGLPIPLFAPTPVVGASAGFTAAVGRFYWFTWADQTINRIHESSSSPISASTGPVSNKNVTVYMMPGTITTSAASAVVTGSGTSFTAAMVGMNLYTNGQLQGVIASVQSATQLTLQANAATATAGVNYVIAPVRCTHWHVYASESDGSEIGQYLASIAITQMSFNDTSPFEGQANSLFTSISRPLRNDPAPVSTILELHKYRLWRRRETKPNFFNYSANEEVAAYANGNPNESVPGADVNTVSDIVNETSYPDSSNRLRALVSHADALYMFTEKQGLPLYGESLDDFGISQVTAFNVGAAGRFSAVSTPHGLVWMSYDRKVYLYPTANYPWAYVPQNVNVTEQTIEIGKPMRKKFEQISFANLDFVQLFYYTFGRRQWLVVCYMDKTNTWQTWVYDFANKGWWQSQRGFGSVFMYEVSDGIQILVGGGSDGFVYVMDDLTGTFTTAAALPAATYRTALIDYGNPDSDHKFVFIEFELSNPSMIGDLTINYYLDPPDADNPGQPTAVKVQPVKIGSNKYRGFPSGGTTNNRMLLEILAASSTNVGSIRGLKLKADPVSDLMP